MSGLKTALWTGAAVVAATMASFTPGGLIAGAIAIFSGLKAWGSHKESQRESAMESAQRAHTNFIQTDRQMARQQAIEQAYGDRDTSVGWAQAEAGRGVGGPSR